MVDAGGGGDTMMAEMAMVGCDVGNEGQRCDIERLF